MLSAFLKEIEQEQARRRTENRLTYYRPYAKQREFHAAGASARERLLMAGNQLGKTLAGGFEAAMHATGRYPVWWQGRRFDKPTIAWVAGVTGESTRDNPQRILLGRAGQHGSGASSRTKLLTKCSIMFSNILSCFGSGSHPLCAAALPASVKTSRLSFCDLLIRCSL